SLFCCPNDQSGSRRKQAVKRSVRVLDAQQLLNLAKIFILSDQANVRRIRNISGTVNDEGCGESIQAAIKLADRIVAQQHPVVDLVFGNVWLHRRPPVFVHRNAEHREAARFILLLKLFKPWNFESAWAAPCSPEVQQNNFAFIIGQADGLSVCIFQREVRSRFAVLLGRRRGAYVLRTRTCGNQSNRAQGQGCGYFGTGKMHSKLQSSAPERRSNNYGLAQKYIRTKLF